MTPTELKPLLIAAVTRHDELNSARARKSRHGYYNPHALPQYLTRVDEVIQDMEKGADPAAAIQAGFNGSLATRCLKACGLKPVENKPNSAWHYVPESER